MGPHSARAAWVANLTRTAGWVGLASAFGIWVAATRGAHAAGSYFAAYLVELSLSIDNVFVFAVIFAQLHIPPQNQRRVLLAGVAGAFVLRAIAVFAGIALINRFHWIVYPFAVLIILGALRVLFGEQRQRRVVEEACDVCATWVGRLIRGITSGAANRAGWSPRRCSSRCWSSKRPTSCSRSTRYLRCSRSPASLCSRMART